MMNIKKTLSGLIQLCIWGLRKKKALKPIEKNMAVCFLTLTKAIKENKNANSPGGVTVSHTAALCWCRGSLAAGLSCSRDTDRCKGYVILHRFSSFPWRYLPLPKKEKENIHRHLSKKHSLKKQLGLQPSSPPGETREKEEGVS